MKEPRTHCTNRFKDFILISKGSQGAVAEPVGVCVCVWKCLAGKLHHRTGQA